MLDATLPRNVNPLFVNCATVVVARVVSPVVFRVFRLLVPVAFRVPTVRLEPEALPKARVLNRDDNELMMFVYSVPDTDRFVADALFSFVCPVASSAVTVALPVAVSLTEVFSTQFEPFQ